NRPSTAHTEHTTPGRCSGAGRAQDGPFAPGHQDFHGLANGGQRRDGRIGPAARDWPRAVEEGWADGGDQLHVHRRPEGETKVQSAGAGIACGDSYETPAPA